jgi:hypothetical protein
MFITESLAYFLMHVTDAVPGLHQFAGKTEYIQNAPVEVFLPLCEFTVNRNGP